MSSTPAAAPPRFAMRGIRKSFGATTALDGVDLSVNEGEICGLIGQNGAGKSTLMSVLSGALEPDAGEMWIDARPFAPHSPIDARRAGVAMIYQELSLAPHLSVMENILMGAEPVRLGLIDWMRMRDMAARALAALGHSDIPPDAVVADLSVAAQQIVEIARAIAVGSRVLVLDEPTSSLGRSDVEHLFELLRHLKTQGHAIVYISHFIEEVKTVADRFIVLRDGRNAGGGETATATHDDIVALMVGQSVSNLFPRSPRVRGEAILEVSGLEPRKNTDEHERLEPRKNTDEHGRLEPRNNTEQHGRLEPRKNTDEHGRLEPRNNTDEHGRLEPRNNTEQHGALEPRKDTDEHDGLETRKNTEAHGGRSPGSASFTLYRGEIFGIAGVLGSGRTHLLRTLFGLEPVRSGRVRIGMYSGVARPHERWMHGMGLLSEDRKEEGLALTLDIADNVTLSKLSPFGPAGLVFPSRQRSATARWISELAIKCAGPWQRAGELSGGNQQKIAIARLLHHEVDVLVLDEPTRGIDVGSKAQIYRLIDALVADTPGHRPRAVLMVSSYLPELLGLCDRIAVMHRGRLGEAVPAATLTEHELMMAVTSGTAA